MLDTLAWVVAQRQHQTNAMQQSAGWAVRKLLVVHQGWTPEGVHCWGVLMTTASGHPAAVANVPAAVVHISHVNLPSIDNGNSWQKPRAC